MNSWCNFTECSTHGNLNGMIRQMRCRREQYRARRDTETSEERQQRLARHYHVVKGHHNFIKALKSDSKLQTQVAIAIDLAVIKLHLSKCISKGVNAGVKMKPSQKKFSAINCEDRNTLIEQSQ